MPKTLKISFMNSFLYDGAGVNCDWTSGNNSRCETSMVNGEKIDKEHTFVVLLSSLLLSITFTATRSKETELELSCWRFQNNC